MREKTKTSKFPLWVQNGGVLVRNSENAKIIFIFLLVDLNDIEIYIKIVEV